MTDRQPQRRLPWVYVAVVLLAGAAVITSIVRDPAAFDAVVDHPVAFCVLAAMLVLSETRPVKLLRMPQLSEEPPPPSTTFVFAILLVFGLPGALVAQGTASVVDDTLRRNPIYKGAFNVAQYAIALFIASQVLDAGEWSILDGHFGARDLPIVIAAAATYHVVNNLLIGLVIALFTGRAIGEMILYNVRDQGWMEWLLLCLAPLTASIAVTSPLLLPLLLLPSFTIFASSRSILEMERRERTDALTRLPNRSGFRAALEEVFDRQSVRGAVVQLDLDRFQYVNDTLGHVVGDHLLQEIAERLRGELPDVDVIARLGGDEFVLFSSSATTEEEAQGLAARASSVFAQPFNVDGLDLAIEASAGIVLAPQHGRSIDELLRRVDIALYLAKSSPDQTSVYDPNLDQHSRRRLRLLGEMRAAIAEGQLVLHYQPQVDLTTGEVSGLEALVRWEHPDFGLISPTEFVALAEHSALIRPLTDWVLEAAVAEARRHLEQHRFLQMSVNVSPRALHDHELPVDLADVLRRYQVPAGMLTIEVTESALADLGAASKVLTTLATMGIGVAIDDFGTGYSTLTYLRQLPVSEIKLDRSFVAGLLPDGADAGIVRSTIELAHYLNLVSVAEGVESNDVMDLLRQFGCTRAQGFLIGHPMAAAELDAWLDGRTTSTLEA